jgi:hypothetical protein
MMERVNTADLAEIVARCLGMKLVLGKEFLPAEQLEFRLVNFDHKCVFAFANGAVADGQLKEVSFDFETHLAAMTAASIGLEWTVAHEVALYLMTNVISNRKLRGREPRYLTTQLESNSTV